MSPADPQRVVVWRLGEAILALPLDDVIEVAPLDRAGSALSREGTLELIRPRGLAPAHAPARALVVRTPAGPRAVAADAVEGVQESADVRSGDPPAWLAGLALPHVRALLRVADGRIAALLSAEGLVAEP